MKLNLRDLAARAKIEIGKSDQEPISEAQRHEDMLEEADSLDWSDPRRGDLMVEVFEFLKREIERHHDPSLMRDDPLEALQNTASSLYERGHWRLASDLLGTRRTSFEQFCKQLQRNTRSRKRAMGAKLAKQLYGAKYDKVMKDLAQARKDRAAAVRAEKQYEQTESFRHIGGIGKFRFGKGRLDGEIARLEQTKSEMERGVWRVGSTAKLDLRLLAAQARAETGKQQAKPKRSAPRASSQQAIRAEIASLRDQQREAALEGLPYSVVMDLMREEMDLRERLKPTRRASTRPRERAEVKKVGKDSWKALTQARDAVVASGNHPGATWPDHFVKKDWLNTARTMAKRLGKELGATTKVTLMEGGPAVDGEVLAKYTIGGRTVEVIFVTTDLGVLIRRAEKVGKSTRWGMHHWLKWSARDGWNELKRLVEIASTDPWG